MYMKKYKFNKFQLAWIKALKSGKYRKGYGGLCLITKQNHKNYCCLGVACDIFNKKISNSLVSNKEDGLITFDSESFRLPTSLLNKLKLRDSSGKLLMSVKSNQHICSSLTELNDMEKWSHKKIGEYIYNNPTNVFY